MVAVPEGVARPKDLQRLLPVYVVDEDVAVDSMFLCSIINLWRLSNHEFSHKLWWPLALVHRIVFRDTALPVPG